jgi:hypothetical protein
LRQNDATNENEEKHNFKKQFVHVDQKTCFSIDGSCLDSQPSVLSDSCDDDDISNITDDEFDDDDDDFEFCFLEYPNQQVSSCNFLANFSVLKYVI